MSWLLALLCGLSVAALAAVLLPPAAARFGRHPSAAPAPALAAGRRGWFAGFRSARRLARLRAQLPEGLATLSTSVRAGLSLPQALAQGAEVLAAPLGEELRQVVQDTALGGTLEEALGNLYRRAPLPEIRLLIAALQLARSSGGSLAPLLDQLTETMRERERLRGQVKTLTAQGRLSGWVVGLMPLALLLVVSFVDPEFLAPLVRTATGLTLLGAALGLELIGAFAIRAVVRVEP